MPVSTGALETQLRVQSASVHHWQWLRAQVRSFKISLSVCQELGSRFTLAAFSQNPLLTLGNAVFGNRNKYWKKQVFTRLTSFTAKLLKELYHTCCPLKYQPPKGVYWLDPPNHHTLDFYRSLVRGVHFFKESKRNLEGPEQWIDLLCVCVCIHTILSRTFPSLVFGFQSFTQM